MPVHNGQRFLRGAIESILTQSLSDLEFVIVDDASTDQTQNIINSFDDQRIRYFRLPTNSGAAAARNLALDHTCGRYVACMDADDISFPDRLQRQARFLDDHPTVGLVACGYDLVNEQGRLLIRNDWGPTDSFPINDLVVCKPYFVGAVYFFRRECIAKVGGYRVGWEMNEDYDLCVRIAEQFDIGMLGKVCYCYRLHDISTTVNQWTKAIRSVVLVRRLAAERRTYGEDRLQTMPEAKVRRFFKKYFFAYDRLQDGSLAVYHLMYARRCFKEGALKAGVDFLLKGLLANPFRSVTLRLIWQILADWRALRQLPAPGTSPLGARQVPLGRAGRAVRSC